LLDNGKITGVNLSIPGFQEDDADWGQKAAMRSLNGCMILPVFKIKKQSQLRRAA
jgi:hypothetical protein